MGLCGSGPLAGTGAGFAAGAGAGWPDSGGSIRGGCGPGRGGVAGGSRCGVVGSSRSLRPRTPARMSRPLLPSFDSGPPGKASVAALNTVLPSASLGLVVHSSQWMRLLPNCFHDSTTPGAFSPPRPASGAIPVSISSQERYHPNGSIEARSGPRSQESLAIPKASSPKPLSCCPVPSMTTPTGLLCKNRSHCLPAWSAIAVITASACDTTAVISAANASTSPLNWSTTTAMSWAMRWISSSSWSVRNSHTSLIPVSGSQMRANKSRTAACTASMRAA
ncbi:Uncharacterised protein [Mycobacterium tuberculosis]|nr:Uncharacterised protein [Mycobacterium tuberculosis]CNZ73596.1 Uncharacterised protein [Mycobacterium tuberculosis]CNZ77847.1 Uncharacterised protein [Mycobacterium tuberculosis]